MVYIDLRVWLGPSSSPARPWAGRPATASPRCKKIHSNRKFKKVRNLNFSTQPNQTYKNINRDIFISIIKGITVVILFIIAKFIQIFLNSLFFNPYLLSFFTLACFFYFPRWATLFLFTSDFVNNILFTK